MRTPERQLEIDKTYMRMAMLLGDLSHATRKKVGAIIVSKDEQIVAQGYNGTPSGMNNCCEYLHNGELKTKDEVLHAESNAIAKCAKFGSSTKDATLYVTMSPCIQCAKLIIQSEIKRVVYLELYHDIDGISLLKKCGISVEQLML